MVKCSDENFLFFVKNLFICMLTRCRTFGLKELQSKLFHLTLVLELVLKADMG